jgi:DNA-binding response OmpR family regulator
MNISIDRSRMVVIIGSQQVQLSRNEYRLLVIMGMMDNKVVPIGLLLDAMSEGRVQIPADKQALVQRIGRLRKKIGVQSIGNIRDQGYILLGDIKFVGDPDDKTIV